MSNKLSYSIASFIAAGILSMSIFSDVGAHGGEDHSEAQTPTVGASGLARLPDGSVNVPKEAQRRMAIRTLIAHEGEHPLTVELNGRVGIDPNAGGRVQAPFAGRIESGLKGLPVAGQRVEKGQVLVHVRPVASAVELGNQQAQLAEIRANRKLAEQRVRRLEALEGAVPQKDVETARAELASLAGRERAVAYSVGGSETITASASGIIATANVLSGQIVEARDVLFEIVDPNRMVVEALTTDPSLATRVDSASLANIPGAQLSLLGGGRSLRDGSLPLNFRVKVGNTPLAIGQPVTVVAKLNDKMKGIALPAEALVHNQANENIVWTKISAERFIPRPVEYKQLDAETIVVMKGLTTEHRVVVSGAALINQIR